MRIQRKKAVLVFLLVLLFPVLTGSAIAKIPSPNVNVALVCGDIENNAVWSGPVLITCDVNVLPGVNVMVLPGATIQFEHQDDDLLIHGTLEVTGTTSSPVIFQPSSGTTPGSWGMVGFLENSSGVLNHAILKNGGYHTEVWPYGILYVASDQVEILNSTVEGSAETGILIDQASPRISDTKVLSNVSHLGKGAGLHSIYGSPIVENCRFENNQAYPRAGGGAIGASGGAISIIEDSPTIRNSVFLNNLVFSESEHGGGGGGISLGCAYSCGSPIVENNQFQGNQVLLVNDTGDVLGPAGSGGALESSGNHHPLVVRDNVFLDNSARTGGGISVVGTNGEAEVQGNVFIGNSAEGGGAIYGYGDNVLIEYNHVERNHSGSEGGGIRASGIIRNNTIISNTVGSRGTGIFAAHDETAIEGNLTDDNLTDPCYSGDGAGIYSPDIVSTVIEGNAIEGNSAEGCNYNQGGGIRAGRNTVVFNNVVSRNSAGVGGAIYIGPGGNTTISHNVLEANSASGRADNGGAAIFVKSGSLVLDGNIIRENRSTYLSGVAAVEVNYLAQGVHIQNNLFERNHVQGLENRGDSSIILNNTFYGNVGFGYNCGGAIFDCTDSSTIRSNIVVSNSASLIGGICGCEAAYPQGPLDYNDVWGNSQGNLLWYSSMVGPNISADPLFMDPQESDFRLSAGSPAIDTANPDDFPATDLNGIPRPIGSGPDIGAFEFVTYPNPDLDGDGDVNIGDVQMIGGDWLSPASWPVDQNGDGFIDIIDIMIVCAHFGE